MVFSAALFGLALFGWRPVPQPATAAIEDHREASAQAEIAPRGAATRERTVDSDGPVPSIGTRMKDAASGVIVRRPRQPDQIGAHQVRVPRGIRVRSAIFLALSTIGTAVLVGAVLSILFVGVVLFVV